MLTMLPIGPFVPRLKMDGAHNEGWLHWCTASMAWRSNWEFDARIASIEAGDIVPLPLCGTVWIEIGSHPMRMSIGRTGQRIVPAWSVSSGVTWTPM